MTKMLERRKTVTLRHLEIYVKVVETGSMSTASKELFVTQPTVSGAISELEKEYKVVLFERLNKRIYITKEGEKLYMYARKMLSIAEDMERQIGSNEDNSPVRIGATVTIGTCMLPEYINQFSEHSFNVDISNTRNIVQLVLSNKLDVGLVEGRVTNDDIRSIPFMKDEMMFICKKNHKLAGRKCVNLEEVLRYPLILREKDSGTRTIIDEAIESKENLKANVIWNCNNTQAIINAVLSEIGVTILSPSLITGYDELCAIRIKDVKIERDFQLIIHKDKYVTNKLQEFMDIVLNK